MADYFSALDFLAFGIAKEKSVRRTQRLQPSTAYTDGLTAREKTEQTEGYRDFDRGYFLRNETRRCFDEYDSAAGWAKHLRTEGLPRAFSDVYLINQLAAYCWTLGNRTVPAVRWAANQATERRSDCRLAVKEFEQRIAEHIRDADAVHRLMLGKPDQAFLTALDTGLIEPLIRAIRKSTAIVAAQLSLDPGCDRVLGLPDDWFASMHLAA